MTGEPTHLSLLLLSGLAIYWLLPTSSYLMLRGEHDGNALLWFRGAWLYAAVVTLFVFSAHLPAWVTGPLAAMLATVSVLCFLEALRRELSPAPPPLAAYAGLLLMEMAVMVGLFMADRFSVWGRGLQVLLIGLLDIGVALLALQVRRKLGGRALYMVAGVFLAVATVNMVRVAEVILTGSYSELRGPHWVGTLGLLTNYLGGVFYNYGYWGFVVEKGRRKESSAIEQAVLARAEQSQSLERQRMAEQTLAERNAIMEKVASMGKLAQSGALSASLTHEMSQPLASVLLNAQQALLFSRHPDSAAQVPALIECAVSETLRAAHTLSQVRRMFEPGPPRPERIDPAQVVRFTASMMERHLAGAGVSVALDLDAARQVLMSPGELEHVLLNLFHNAIDAMQDTPQPQREIRITIMAPQGTELCLCFEDSGPGIKREEADVIFEMNFSSKPQHMGMGLWLARFIVERHGARIWLEAGDLPSSRFMLALPLAQEGGHHET